MSFLPYAPHRASTWMASIGGSTAIHGAVVFGVLTSSVALLPEPSSPAVREPKYEVTLEIIDADIIDLDEVDDTPEIPPEAVAIEPEDPTAELPEEANDALAPDEDELLAPEDDATLGPNDETALVTPDEDILAPEAEEELALLQPEPEAPTSLAEPEIVPEVVQDQPLAPEPDIAPLPDAFDEPLAPAATVDPDDVAIDDLSPVDDTVFSPLAEAVAPAAPVDTPLAPDAVVPNVVEPEPNIVEEDIAAVVLPEPDVTLPTPEFIEPEPEAEDVAPVALPVEPDPETTEAPQSAVTEEDVAPDQQMDADIGTATAAIANPSPAALQIGNLLQRIRDTPAPQCALVLPRRAGDTGVGLSFIGTAPDTLDTLASRIIDGLDVVPAQTREILDPRQCAALDAVRQSATYPASRIGLSLNDTTLNSGDTLRVRILGAGGLFLTLLLIDDNGVVQDLARFTTLDGNDPIIDVPVARAGPARDTRQVLLVLGSIDAPIDLSNGIGREAQDAFGNVPLGVLEAALFGVATFDVR